MCSSDLAAFCNLGVYAWLDGLLRCVNLELLSYRLFSLLLMNNQPAGIMYTRSASGRKILKSTLKLTTRLRPELETRPTSNGLMVVKSLLVRAKPEGSVNTAE